MNTNEKCCPSSGQEKEATSLFFTKAPGEDHYKAYARYNNCPSWVPIDTPQSSTPNLQQVRDADRNISANGGSYEDAHFYLRSAEGNNMTSAFFTNAEGGGIQTGNTTGFAPLNLQPDGGTLTYGGDEVATKPWIIDQKKPELIPSGANLDDYTTTGLFLQRVDAYAAAGTNYPVARAGMLEVQNGNNNEMIFQRYTTWGGGGTQFWKRMAYMGTWYAWERLMGSNEGVTWGYNTAGNMFNGYAGNSVLYNYPWVGTPDGGAGFSWNAAENNASGIYSAQMYMGMSAGPGAALDSFFYRANQQGGSGWPTPWFRVASREWVGTAVIKNQNTAAQTANMWIDGNVRAAAVVDHTHGYAMISQSGYTGFFTDTSLNTAHPVKMGALTISNAYADTAPANGIFVKGKSYLTDNVGIGNVSPTEKLDVTGSIKQSAVTSSLLKADGAGKIIAAVAGTDYQVVTVESGLYTPTVSNLKGSVSSVTGKCLFTRNGDVVTVSGGLEITLGASSPVGAGFELSLPIASILNLSEDCSGLGSGSLSAISGISIEPSLTNDKAAVNFDRTTATGTYKVNIFFMYKVN